MATFTAARAADDFPVYEPRGGGDVGFAYGLYTPAANFMAADIVEMCKVPGGCTVIDGFVRAADIDTGTETLDIDVGWSGNGVEAADPDGFGNLGVWTGDAVTGVKPETGSYYPFNGVLMAAGPKFFTNETTIQLTVNAAAAVFASGPIYAGVYFLAP